MRAPDEIGSSRSLSAPLAAIMALALLLRTLPWWPSNNFRGVLEYDDGVYYAASRLLLHGHLPYSDFTIVHPPGLSLLLLPAALLGDRFGDSVGMAAGRVEMQLFALGNVVLVYALAGLLPGSPHRRRARALVAAGLYAIIPTAVAAEQTILLEPLATFACLVATWLLLRRRQPTRAALVAAGAFLAFGVGLKLFAGAYVVAAVAYLLWTRRPRALLPLTAGGLAGIAVVFVPFFLSDPSAAWHDIVVTQLGRPKNPTVPQGLDRLVSMVGLGYATVPIGLLLILLIAVVTTRGLRGPEPHAIRFWSLVLVLAGFAFVTSPTYFLHYGEFLAPPVALLASRLLDLSRLRWAAGAVGVAFAVGTAADVGDLRGQADLRAATASVPHGACVYYDAISLALAADLYEDPTPRCPSYVDGRGVALTQNPHWDDRTSFYPAGFVADEQWQADNVLQMRHASYLLLRHDPARFPEWDASTRRYVLDHFAVEVRHTDGRQPFELWKRTTPG
ncbi:MAG: glycosyltransferase family 39 protein [Mycobacteriales bacterium]